jgi:hypothetical protein
MRLYCVGITLVRISALLCGAKEPQHCVGRRRLIAKRDTIVDGSKRGFGALDKSQQRVQIGGCEIHPSDERHFVLPQLIRKRPDLALESVGGENPQSPVCCLKFEAAIVRFKI